MRACQFLLACFFVYMEEAHPCDATMRILMALEAHLSVKVVYLNTKMY